MAPATELPSGDRRGSPGTARDGILGHGRRPGRWRSSGATALEARGLDPKLRELLRKSCGGEEKVRVTGDSTAAMNCTDELSPEKKIVGGIGAGDGKRAWAERSGGKRGARRRSARDI